MHPARIAELLEPFLSTSPAKARGGEPSVVLSPGQLQHISMYIDILLKWNARINLTAIRDEEQIVTRHFGESLFAARHLFPLCSSVPSVVKASDAPGPEDSAYEPALHTRSAPKGTRPGAGADTSAPLGAAVADVGSGAGFPGIPIKLWAPHISLMLIESHHKKATFLREVTRALTLTDVNIQTVRAESLPVAKKFDVVTLRAVERFEAILPIAAGLLAPVGRLALLIGVAQVDQARTILSTVTWSDPYPIPGSRSRVLLLGRTQALSDTTLEPRQ